EFFLDQSKIADLLAKGLAFLGIFGGSHQDVFGTTDARGAESKAAGIQHIEGNDVAATNFVQDIFFWHEAIFEEHRSGGTAVDTHFMLFIARLAARESALDDEGG